MMRFLRALRSWQRAAVVTYVLIPAGCAGQSADGIAARHLAAVGGLDRLVAIRASITETIKTLDGKQSTCVYYLKRPNKVGMEMAYPAVAAVMAYNGVVGWKQAIMSNGERRPPSPITESETRHIIEDFEGSFADSLLDYEKGHVQLRLAGRESVLGSDAYILEITRQDGATERRFIDIKSYMEVATSHRDAGSGVLYKMIRDDFRRSGGIMVPFHEVLYRDGKVFMETTCTKVRFLSSMDDSVFEKPQF